MKSAATDPATKSRALQRAAEVGAAQASRETGVPAGTIRAWRARDAEARAVSVASADVDDVERLRRIAAKSRQAAEQAIDRLNEVIPHSKDPQRLSVSVGVLIDKAQMLADTVLALDERRVRMTQRDSKAIVALFQAFFAAVGLPLETGGPIAGVLASMLRQAGENLELVAAPPDKTEAARAAIRDTIRKELYPGIRSRSRRSCGSRRPVRRPARRWGCRRLVRPRIGSRR